jgi:uncharacterized glyoxalase superfamily protein PhnB
MAGLSSVPVLGCADVEAGVAYWRDVLGFEARHVFRDPEGEAVYAILALGEAGVHLQIRRLPVVLQREDFEGDAYFYVDDVDVLYKRHRSAGATITREIEDEDYGMRDYSLTTSDGHQISFGSHID